MKRLIIVLLVLSLLFISSGYAYLRTDLTISGKIKFADDFVLPKTDEVLEKLKVKVKEDNVDFNQPSFSDEGVHAIKDDYGTSYYYRGKVTNNYVKFAGFYWRIIRINGDGSVRLIYDGTYNHRDGQMSTDRVLDGKTAYDDSNVEFAESDVISKLNEWYEEHLKDYEEYLADGTFCSDLSKNGERYVTEDRYLDENDKQKDGVVPVLTCPKEYRYTAESKHGNGKLTHPIGMITADEIVISGSGKFDIFDSSYYLYKGQNYWTITPSGSGKMYIIDLNGRLQSNDINASDNSVAPVINLKAETILDHFTGNGTEKDPFKLDIETE